MAIAVRWTQHAATELQQAALFLEDARPGTGSAFVDAIEDALAIVAQFPRSTPRIPGEPENTRKAVIPRYGYWIVYEAHADVIVVLTVWHAVQSPGSWRQAGAP